jgi:autotransporter-associated beta strand protein
VQQLALHPDGNSYVGRAADDSDIRGWRVPATAPGTNGSFNLASRWQGGVIPGVGDVAIVEDDGTVSMSGSDPNWRLTDIRVGSSMGSLGAMSQTGGKVTQDGWMRIGINGTGSLEQSGGTNQIAGFLTVGENQGSSGFVNLRGTGTLTCGDLAVGWSHSTSKGEVLMQQGTLGVSAATFIGLEGTGTMSVVGGTMNVTGNGWGAFRIGNWPNTNSMGSGTVNLLGGTVNANKTTTVGGFGNGVMNVSGGTWNQNAGNLYVGEKVDATYFGSGEVNQSGGILNSWYVFLQQGNYNLNGGTLSVAGVGDGAANATGVFNFNGGVLQGTFSNANFLAVDTAKVQVGGAILDTQSNELTISQPLAGPGGLTKRGTGRLTLSGALAYLGSTKVEAGTLEVPGPNFKASIGASTMTVAFLSPPPDGEYAVLPGSLNGNPACSFSGLGAFQTASFTPLGGKVTVATVSGFNYWAGTNMPMTPELLLAYGVGGATAPGQPAEQIALSIVSGVLRLTAVVRTNDPAVSVSAQTSTNLLSAPAWVDVVTNRFGIPSSNTNGVPTGCQRRIFETSIQGEPRKFLKLNITIQ